MPHVINTQQPATAPQGPETYGVLGGIEVADEAVPCPESCTARELNLPETWLWWAARALSLQQRLLAGPAASLHARMNFLWAEVGIGSSGVLRPHARPKTKYSQSFTR